MSSPLSTHICLFACLPVAPGQRSGLKRSLERSASKLAKRAKGLATAMENEESERGWAAGEERFEAIKISYAISVPA